MTVTTETTRPQCVCILTSPRAGSGRGCEQVERLVTNLCGRGIDAWATNRVPELQQAVAQYSPDDLLVVAAGGDGTVTLAGQQISASTPLAVMPLGTENLLAKHFGFRRDAESVAETIAEGQDRSIDAGLAVPITRDGKPRGPARLFLVMLTAGFDAEVVRAVHLRRRGHVSRWTYAPPIWRAVRRYRFPNIHVEAESPLPPTRWAMLFNLAAYAASLPLMPDARDDDGSLDALLLDGGSTWQTTRYLLALRRGKLADLRDVRMDRAADWNLRSPGRVPYQLDGDYAGRLPVRVQTLPGRIRLRLPAGWRSPKLPA